MASSSSSKGKGLDKREDEGRKKEYKDMHVKLDYKFIEALKNRKEWPAMKPGWTVTEEQVHEMAMKTYDFDYVLKNHLLDEEIVWEEDVWGSKHINAIPDAHAKKEEKGKK